MNFGRFTDNLGYFFIVALLSVGCNKEINERNLSFAPLSPSNLDTTGGNWLPILLSSNEEFALETPEPVTSQNYKLELQEVRSIQAKNELYELNNFNYWSAGSILRWNEILRELVAKYNLPPYQNQDGTYPIPNPNNPLAYPLFPFANPPYAARAYAYVCAAQYDALVIAYHYKHKFKRLRPYQIDPNIILKGPEINDFSYPSEQAVIAGASVAMLSQLFPGEQDFLQSKLLDCINSRLFGGYNVRSEIEAGLKLGKQVAQKFIDRARQDRAGKAVGTPSDWQLFVTTTENRGEIPWKSLESPARPPMLPLFGRTIGFLLDTTEVVNGRPTPPPSTSSEQFQKELNEVLEYSQNATRENMRVVHFWGDGVGTYAPPGHWNAIACEDFVQLNFSEIRWARNLALLNMAMFDAAICCWDAKYFYFNPRPSQINPKIKTLTGVPNFPAYVSGHSTFSGAAATVLSHINGLKSSQYNAMADEASRSRLIGAIHYRSDIEVGMKMGKSVGNKAVSRAKSDGAE